MQGTDRTLVSHDYTRWGLAVASVLGVCVVVIFCASVPFYTAQTWSIIAAASALMMVICNIWCIQIDRHASSSSLAIGALVSGMLFAGCCALSASWYIPTSRRAVMSALCVCCAIACDAACMASVIRDARLWGVARTSSIIACSTAFACAITILYSLHTSLLVGTVLAVSICAIQLMPNLVVHVPDRYGVEWRRYMKQRWTVRGGIPQESRVLRPRDIRRDMQEFLSSYATGVVWCVGLAVISCIVLLYEAEYSNIYSRIGVIVLCSSLIVWLVLKPRTSSRAFERYMMRAAALCIAAFAIIHIQKMLQLPALSATSYGVIAGVCVLGACVMIATMLAQQGGFYSLVLSRVGDAICFLALSLIPVSAFFAAGTLEWLRGLQW